MKFSSKTFKLGAAFAALVSVVTAAAPAGADTWRGELNSTTPATMVSVHYSDRGDSRFERMRYEHRRAMFWREMQCRHVHHYGFDGRFGDHARSER